MVGTPKTILKKCNALDRIDHYHLAHYYIAYITTWAYITTLHNIKKTHNIHIHVHAVV